MDRDRLAGFADLYRHALIFQEESDLLQEIAAVQVRPRHRGLVHAGAGDEAVGQPGINPGIGSGGDADERVGGAHPRRQGLAP